MMKKKRNRKISDNKTMLFTKRNVIGKCLFKPLSSLLFLYLTKQQKTSHHLLSSHYFPFFSFSSQTQISLIYVDNDYNIYQKNLPNMVVKSCDCAWIWWIPRILEKPKYSITPTRSFQKKKSKSNSCFFSNTLTKHIVFIYFFQTHTQTNRRNDFEFPFAKIIIINSFFPFKNSLCVCVRNSLENK